MRILFRALLLRSPFFLPILVLSVFVVGCAGPEKSKAPDTPFTGAPIRVESADLVVTLIRIAVQGSERTLIEDPGWREFILEVENLSRDDVTVRNVKLLNVGGRYVDSASTYQQITAPPDVGTELAGDVAGTAAGIAAGQIIPYGGTIFGLLSSAASATSAEAKANASRIFMLRVLKNVELAPGGKIEGSAYLPNITGPKTLVVDCAQGVKTYRVEIPLSMQ